MADDYQGWDWSEGFEEPRAERPRDPQIDRAKTRIMELLEERDREALYGRQVEVFLEKEFFHWITDFALKEVVDERVVGTEEAELEKGVWMRFYFNPGHRYRKREIKGKVELVRELSRVAGPCGGYAELLFKLAFMKRGFVLRGEEVREFEGRKWEESRHDLDFVIEREGRVYGVEVKNRLDYIEREELEIKLGMCAHLKLLPVFVMRAAAKSYNYMVIEAGGFALIFGTQIYPPGQEGLVKRIRDVLELPVVVSSAIPEGLTGRFEKWHERQGV